MTTKKIKMANPPVAIQSPETVVPRLDPRTVLHVGGIWGQVRAGQTWMASDGPRFVWSADSVTVIYSLKDKFYAQRAKDFVNEVTSYPLVEAGRRAKFGQRVSEIGVKLLMGVLAGASGVGFALVIGTEIAEFMFENQENFAKWKHQFEAVLKARKSLKAQAPTLYDKVFDSILNKLTSKLPEAVTADTVAFGVGVIVGTAGKKLAHGKFSLLAVIFVVLEQIVIRFSLDVLPCAVMITGEEYEKLAEVIINKMRDAGVTISKVDIQKIVQEVNKHPAEIKEVFKMLQEVFSNQPKRTP
jgi:hypothetical protein